MGIRSTSKKVRMLCGHLKRHQKSADVATVAFGRFLLADVTWASKAKKYKPEGPEKMTTEGTLIATVAFWPVASGQPEGPEKRAT